jgi:hypothetical protein
MRRFSLISTVHVKRDLRINNAFIRMLAVESKRLGADIPLTQTLDRQESSVRERYAPMQRLLVQADELFLVQQGLAVAAKQLRRQRRSCYFQYVRWLTREIRAARRLGALAMASQEQWSFWNLLTQTFVSESSLLYLRWLGCRHAAGIGVAAQDVSECLEFLLGGPRFHLATT